MSTDPLQEFIYVLSADSSPLVKIGKAKDPANRLKLLQTGSPLMLQILWTCPGGLSLEAALHQRFAAHRRQGEWFDLRPLASDPVEAVRSAVAAIHQNPATPQPNKDSSARYRRTAQGYMISTEQYVRPISGDETDLYLPGTFLACKSKKTYSPDGEFIRSEEKQWPLDPTELTPDMHAELQRHRKCPL